MMKNKRIQAQFLINGISDDVPQLLLEENNLVFRNELKEDVLIPFSSIISIKILPINRIYNPSVGILKEGMKGFMTHRNAGVFSIFYKLYKLHKLKVYILKSILLLFDIGKRNLQILKYHQFELSGFE